MTICVKLCSLLLLWVFRQLLGDLIRIDGRGLHTFIEHQVKDIHWTADFWIGLNDISEEGLWRWANRSGSKSVMTDRA